MGNDESSLKDENTRRFRVEEMDDYYERKRTQVKTSRRFSTSHERSRSRWSRSPKRTRRTYEVQYPRRYERFTRSWSRSPGRSLHRERDGSYNYCADCDVYSSGDTSHNQHMIGKRHAYNIERKYQVEHQNLKISKKRGRKSHSGSDQGQNNGFDYILIVQKHGKSFFHCFLCDTDLDCEQLKCHILGDKHQRTYSEEQVKGAIKIKRLKWKGSLEESIEQIMFNLNERNANPQFERTAPKKNENSLHKHDKRRSNSSPKLNRSSTCATRRQIPSAFIRKTIEQVEFHNKMYNLKMTSTTYCPENKKLSPPTAKTFSKDWNSSPDCVSPLKYVSSSEEYTLSPELHPKTVIPNISELIENFSTKDICNLLVSKLSNTKMEEVDVLTLDDAADKITALSTKLKIELLGSSWEEKKDMQENIPPIDENVNMEEIAMEEMKGSQEDIPNETVNTEEIAMETQNCGLELETITLSEGSDSSVDQPVQSVKLPDTFWDDLPSAQQLDELLNFWKSDHNDEIVVFD